MVFLASGTVTNETIHTHTPLLSIEKDGSIRQFTQSVNWSVGGKYARSIRQFDYRKNCWNHFRFGQRNFARKDLIGVFSVQKHFSVRICARVYVRRSITSGVVKSENAH